MSEDIKKGVAFGFGFACDELFERNIFNIGYTIDVEDPHPTIEPDADIALALQRELVNPDERQ